MVAISKSFKKHAQLAVQVLNFIQIVVSLDWNIVSWVSTFAFSAVTCLLRVWEVP